MNGTGPEFFQSLIVGPGAVALVDVKAIGRVGFRQAEHHIVPGYFGKDRGGGDIQAEAISFYDRANRQAKVGFPVAVNKRQVRPDLQLFHCPPHGEKGCL